MPSGILSAILDTTGERVKERLDQTNQLDTEMRETQTKALLSSIYATNPDGTPKLSPEQIEEAWGRIEKLHSHNKGVKDILLKAKEITQHIFGGGKPNQAMAGRAQQQTADALGGGQGGPLVPNPPSSMPIDAGGDNKGGDATPLPYTPPPPGRQLAPIQQVANAAAMTAPQKKSTSPASIIAAGSPAAQQMATTRASQDASVQSDADVQLRLMKTLETDPQYAELVKGKTKGQVLDTASDIIAHRSSATKLTASMLKPSKISSYIGGDKKQHNIMQQYNPETQGWDHYVIDSDGEVRGMRGTLNSAAPVTANTAKQRAAQGEKYLLADGREIDTNSLTPNQELVPWTGDPDLIGKYAIADQNTKQITADNLVRTFPSRSPESQTPQGVARVATTQEVPEVNNEGQLELLKTVTAPVNPATTIPQTNMNAAPTTGAATGTTTPPQTTTRPATGSGPSSRVIPNMLPSTERDKQLSRVNSVRAAGTQLLGKPEAPDEESLSSPTFAKLADDPAARERIGRAARFLIQDISAADSGSPGVGVSLMGYGASANGGDIWGAIKNTTGINSWIASKQAEATDAAISSLKPEEYRYLNQVMAAYGTIIGLRTITKAGAYQASVKSIERELPIIGFADVPNSKAYYNKLGKLGNEIVDGLKGISPDLLKEKQYYIDRAKELNELGRDTTKPIPPPARQSAPADRIKVKGPNGETGTVPKGSKLPAGWSEVKG